jgi:hypothetical protein
LVAQLIDSALELMRTQLRCQVFQRHQVLVHLRVQVGLGAPVHEYLKFGREFSHGSIGIDVHGREIRRRTAQWQSQTGNITRFRLT